MKTNAILYAIALLGFFHETSAQTSYREDSIQFKIYTRLYVNEQLQTDSVVVKKVFCDLCSTKQFAVLEEEARRQTYLEQYNPKYRRAGEHRLALVVRFSKDDFKNLNNNDE